MLRDGLTEQSAAKQEGGDGPLFVLLQVWRPSVVSGAPLDVVATPMAATVDWCPRPESNRHALRRGIFFPLRLSPPARGRCSWAGARLHHSLAAVGARRLLSTPSQAAAWAWLGVGSGARASRAFADFDGLHFGRFPPKAQIVQVPCVYPFHHSGVVLNALKTPTSIYWRLAGPWPSSLAAKLQLGCPQTVVTIDLLAR